MYLVRNSEKSEGWSFASNNKRIPQILVKESNCKDFLWQDIHLMRKLKFYCQELTIISQKPRVEEILKPKKRNKEKEKNTDFRYLKKK